MRENITIVIKKFAKNGFSAEEIAVRMDVPFHYIKSCLQ
ncbi:glyoxalase [Clostridium botulinum]|nr:glyoxalase [Clostridium botulinum]NFR15828.1 glyoxalase [Clostridium botulinum]NFR44702.1 glyoxalase [Clostridium botulinum]NFS51559.1 glyoxalase [Clostridium botulinum]